MKTRAKTILKGSYHARFGSYGPQDGDGTPTISGGQTAEAIAAFTVQSSCADLSKSTN